jgi:hypothetical protein
MYTRRNRFTFWVRRSIGSAKVILGRRRKHFYFDKKQKKIIIGEKYQGKIKFASRFILIISVITSFVAIPPPFSIIVSLGLIMIEQTLERVVYSFTTLHIVPFPDFDTWKKADFTAMIFARFGKNVPPNIGMVFKNETFARDVWKFIEGWNYNNEVDTRTNNIRVSVVINEKAKSYAVFIYPDFDRPSVKASRRRFQKGNENKEQQLIVGQMIMCKVFPLENSGFQKIFLPDYKSGENYVFSCWVLDNPPRITAGTIQIKKNDFKIIKYTELTTKDMEHHMAKYRIDWYDSEPNKPSMFYVRED